MRAARAGRIDLYTSTPLLIELADLLARRKFARKVAALPFPLEDLMARYALLAAVVRPAAIARTASDADDDVVLATAAAARADMVVTGDKGLLALRSFQRIRMLGVTEALSLLP